MKRRPVLLTLFAICFASNAVLAQDDPEANEETSIEVTDESGDVLGECDGGCVESGWWIDWFGYVRVAFEQVQDDPNFDYVGNNNTGFVLHNARFGISGQNPEYGVGFQISVDGVTDLRDSVNAPQGQVDVRLRDAYLRFDPTSFAGLQVGQFKAPFSAEELRSTGDLLFASRAVGLEGIGVGRGIETEGIVVGRELGAMLSPEEPIWVGDFGISYYIAAMNGNGRNELLNDNNDLALFARLELHYSDMVSLGGSVLMNDRTVGELPNIYEEEDFGFSGDLLVQIEGFELYSQFTEVTTEFPTTGADDQVRRSLHAQLSYRFDQLCIPFAPAYRFATYHPHANADDTTSADFLNGFEVTYHTVGLTVWHPHLPLSGILNYTITGEEESREIENNRAELLLQVIF